MADRDDVLKRVIKVTAQVLKLEPAQVKPEANFVFDLGAESVDSISLVAGFEKEFNIEMEEEAALEVQTVANAVDFVMKYVK